MTSALGIDVGGTKLASGLLTWPGGEIHHRRVQPTRPERGGEAVLADVEALARSLLAEARASGFAPAALGVAVAELVSPAGEVQSEATIRWRGLPVRERLGVLLPTRLEADVRAAALAEARCGAGRGCPSFVYVTIGTGISSCLVLGGKPHPGARGLSGTCASSPGLIAGDGNTLLEGPPLEAFASGPALAARFQRLRPSFTGSATEVLALARAGDTEAEKVVETAARAVGAALAQLVNVLDPERVVIGGGLGLAGGCFGETLEAELRRRVWSDLHRDLPVVTAGLGADADWIGAALAALLADPKFSPCP